MISIEEVATTQLRAAKLVPKLHKRSLRGTSKPSRVHNAPTRQQDLGNTMHPRVTSFSKLQSHVSPRRTQIYAPNAKGKSTSAQILHSQIPTKQQILMGNKRGRTKRRTTKELQNPHPLSSPHLEERLIGGNVDIDLLSCFPKDGQESLERLREIQAFSKSNKGGERKKWAASSWGRRRLFIASPKN